MNPIDITVSVDEKSKREFEEFCDDAGMDTTTAINMFIKATLRTRRLPFVVADYEARADAKRSLAEAFKNAQSQSKINGTGDMSIDEINSEIDAYRREKRAQ